MLVKYLSAWDEFWGLGFKSPGKIRKNVIDGIDVANPSKCNWIQNFHFCCMPLSQVMQRKELYASKLETVAIVLFYIGKV